MTKTTDDQTLLCRCHHELKDHEDAGKGSCLSCACERYEADPEEIDEKTGPYEKTGP